MAIQRTLKQKKIAEARREVTYHWNGQGHAPLPQLSLVDATVAPAPVREYHYDLLGYPLRLVYEDVAKTLAFSLLMLCALVALKILKV